MTPINAQADDNEVHELDTGHMSNHRDQTEQADQTDRRRRPAWQAPFVAGLIGVAAGAAIGAGTGMWWMMGVLGGVFSVFGVGRRSDQTRNHR